MALGDRERFSNAIDYGIGLSQQPLNETRQRVTERGQNIWNQYQTGSNQNLADYNSIMNAYSQFRNPSSVNMQAGDTSSFGNLTDPGAWMNLVGNPQQLAKWVQASYPGLSPEGVNYYVQHIQEKPGANPQEQAGSAAYWQGRMPEWLQQHSGDPFTNAITQAIGGFGNFAETGGFSPQDINNIRARMIAPIRAVYSNANRAVDTQKRQQHGYSPNYTAAKAKMAREQAYATSDATTNAEAAIAQMLQQGKLAGLGGLGQVGEGARGQNLASITGQTNLFGQNPGLAQTFGNLVTQNQSQDLQGQQLAQALSQMYLDAQLNKTKVPTNFNQVLGNIAGLMSLTSQGAQALSGFPGLFGNPWGSGSSTLGDVGTVVKPT